MSKPDRTATIVQFPPHRIVRRNGVPTQAVVPPQGLAGAARAAPRADLDFGSWYHFAAIKDQDRTGP